MVVYDRPVSLPRFIPSAQAVNHEAERYAERMHTMRVLHVGPVLGFGGAETVTVSLVREQRRTGIQADAFFFKDLGGSVQFDGVCDVWFHDQKPLSEVILAGNYDVVHMVAAAVPWSERSIRRSMFRGAVVITHHGWFTSSMGSDFVTAVSRFAADEIQDRCSKPVYVVYNGLDLTRFCPGDRGTGERPIVGWVGRAADAQKDACGLVAAAVSGLTDGYKIVAVDGSEENSQLKFWLPPDSEVLSTVPWREMPDFYRRVAASGGFLLCTSRIERCPMMILEAQACGCPVIAPAVGGIPEIVDHGVTGYVYDRSRGVEGIREGMDWLYSGDRHERACKAASDYIAANFTAEKTNREYVDIYKQAVASHRPGFFNMAAQRAMLPGVRTLRKLKRRGRRSEAAGD